MARPTKFNACNGVVTGLKYGVLMENTRYCSGTAMVNATIMVTCSWRPRSVAQQRNGGVFNPRTAPPCFTTKEMKMLNTMHRPK